MAGFIGALSAQLDMPMSHILLQSIGVLGSIAYVAGFFLVQSGKLCGNGLLYPCSKLFAAICVSLSLLTAFNLAALLIQISFITIALYGICFRLSRQISARRDRFAAMTVPQGLSQPSSSNLRSEHAPRAIILATNGGSSVAKADATTVRAA